ncbi:ribonuclease H-like YkuK family protein [Paenibacillus turpanensis]|uniref:ribonuclease H-like YkuK family protein n=1 Tax=Paenibacillus turpanensis TaxID=2689078 RepID=UPI0014074A46|nr:ribonuclease H-like YkuK family protein [Paenibacillus turpanensis]
MHFVSPTWGTMTVENVVRSVMSFVQEDPKAGYKLVIGTDSQTSKHGTTMVTALIVHRVGKGARFFFRRIRSKPLHDLRFRIYKETELSLETVDVLNSQGMAELLSKYPFEIHIDIGQQGDTKVLIQEIKGWVTSVGYEARIKPFSFGASSVADRFTHG